MAITKLETEKTICKEGDPLKELFVIGEGRVLVTFPGGSLELGKGDVIGIHDIKSGVHSCTYTTLTEVSLVPYTFGGVNQLLEMFLTKPNVMHLFFTSSVRFSNHLLKGYENLIEEIGELPLEVPHDESALEQEKEEIAAAAITEVVPGLTPDETPVELSEDDKAAAALFPELTDLSEEEAKELAALPGVAPGIDDHAPIPKPLEDALDSILEFAKCDMGLAQRFKQEVDDYKAMPDKDSTDDAARRFRNELTKDFYELYTKVFEESLYEQRLPIAVRLFLNFGFVDAELAGASNSAYLLSIIDSFRGEPENGVFTFYEWLNAIYDGEREPSRNEFDLDYPEYLRDLRKGGKITEREEKKLLHSEIDKVFFELENVFPIVNKITFGRITTFCPLLSAHNLLKPLADAIITPQKLADALKEIRKVDFSAFYRETIYTNEECGIPKEYIQVEVLPDFILMPNAGIRGAMWQEIEGRRRATPARMMLSVIELENVTTLVTRMTGEFRWEMCKRIQGAHWNNIAERSLTSEYTDYIQFYKRNRELSPEAKEKLRRSLQRAKNSLKEMFVRDYLMWVNYEGAGAPRLNKIARAILFRYCPFSNAIRETLSQHPLYLDLVTQYKVQTGQKLHHIDVLCGKIQKTGNEIPEEIYGQIDFLNA